MIDPHERYYDFDRDVWVATSIIRPFQPERELPPPFEPPAKGFWTAPPGPDRSKRPIGTWLPAGAALLVLGLAVGSICPLALLGLLFVANPRRKRSSHEHDDLLEIDNDHDVCLVEMAVVRDGRVVGTDQGAAWFEAGRLLFCGRRTSFAIGGEDVQPRALWRPSRREERAVLRAYAIPLRVPGPETHVEFGVLKDGRDLAQRRFVERLGAFRAHPPHSRGPRQWPPFER